MSTTTVQEPKSDNDTISLFDLGTLVNLRIGSWSGRKIITRADLIKVGYDPGRLPEEICNLGRKILVPKSEIQALNQIEQRARKLLERYSVPFGISSSHFVPHKMIVSVEQQIKELRKEFFERVDSFISRFDDLVESVKTSHPEFWEKCLKGNYPANPQALRSKYKFDLYLFKVAGIGSIEATSAEEVVATQKVQTEREIELRKQMKQEVGNFVEEYTTSIRGGVVQFCDLMTARITGKPYGDEEESRKLTSRSVACFRKHIDQFMSMNIFGDSEIEKMLSAFRDTFLDSGVTPKDFDSANIKDSVTKSLEAIRNKAAAEGESGSKFIGELKRKIVLG